MIALLAFLIIFPLIEIYVMIEVGGMIGAFNTILTIIFTAIAGIYYARIEGINTLRSGILNLVRGTMPFFEIISGAAIAFASFLLIVPGFISDVIGFILIFPFTRKILFNIVSSKIPKEQKHRKNFIEGDFEEVNNDETEDRK